MSGQITEKLTAAPMLVRGMTRTRGWAFSTMLFAPLPDEEIRIPTGMPVALGLSSADGLAFSVRQLCSAINSQVYSRGLGGQFS